MKRGKFIFINCFLVGLIMIFTLDNYGLTVSQYTIKSDRVPKAFDGFKIVQLSDFHGRNGYAQRIIDKTNGISPDIIVMTGDMVNSMGDIGFDEYLSLCRGLTANYPIYHIAGNHEQALSTGKNTMIYFQFIKTLQSINVKILENEEISIQKGGQEISLYGLKPSLLSYSEKSLIEGYTDAYLFPKTPANVWVGSYRILLAHNPLYISKYVKWGPDLVLSGHLHGGIIRLPFLGGLLSPDKTFFPEYSAGLFKEGITDMIVSRGIGNSVINFRLFNPPEIVEITLKSA